MSPSHAGTGPLRSFQERLRKDRFSNRPSALGMGPVNSFDRRDSLRRRSRLPSPEGIVPVRPFSGSSSSVTRPDESVVTPYQPPSGADVFQFVSVVQLAPPVAS